MKKDTKRIAIAILKNLRTAGVQVSLGQVQNAVGSAAGMREWNTLSAHLVQSEAADRKMDLSDSGPYATGDDAETARELGISIETLRRDRALEDRGQAPTRLAQQSPKPTVKAASIEWNGKQEVSVLLKATVNVRLKPFKASSPIEAIEKAERMAGKSLEEILRTTNPSDEIEHTEWDDGAPNTALIDFVGDLEHRNSAIYDVGPQGDWELTSPAAGADQHAGTPPSLVDMLERFLTEAMSDIEDISLNGVVYLDRDQYAALSIKRSFTELVVWGYEGGKPGAEPRHLRDFTEDELRQIIEALPEKHRPQF